MGSNDQRSTIRKVAVSSFLGNFIEWFDYATYSYFAVVIANVFFPGDDPALALMQTFAVFALSFLLRPIGAIFWGSMGDKKGRKWALSTSIFLMTGATFCIGLLPGYLAIGLAAPILLLACMMVSGMVFFTASSVSLEGKSYWIVRSMPVETKKILQAKLNLSNSLAVAPALVMMLAAALVLRVSAAETALLLACQLLFVLLTANVGLMEDLRHCNLDWINETQAAKQGAGVLLSMLLAFGFVVAVGALYFFLLAVLMPVTAALGLILALMAILYALTARWLMTRGVKRFETLR